MSSSVVVELLVLKDFRRVLIIFDCPITKFTLQNEKLIVGYDRVAISHTGVFMLITMHSAELYRTPLDTRLLLKTHVNT